MTDIVKVRMVRTPEIEKQAVMIANNQFYLNHLVDIPLIVLEDCFSNPGGQSTCEEQLKTVHRAYILPDMSLMLLVGLGQNEKMFLEMTIGPNYWTFHPWSLSVQDDYREGLPGLQQFSCEYV